MAELWIVAGPNGAGKTTFVQGEPLSDLISHATYLNPDDIALAILRGKGIPTFSDAPDAIRTQAFLEAAIAVFNKLIARLATGEAVVVETVMSTDKYRRVVESVDRDGGFFGLIYVWLDSPETACSRVRARTERGGHDVPTEKIVARWHRSVDTAAWFLAQATRFWVYDNTNSDPKVAPPLLAQGGHGECSFIAPTIPIQLLNALPPHANP